MRKNNGFTLVELLVVIAVSSTVLLAAASLMLMGSGSAARPGRRPANSRRSARCSP